MTLDGKRRKALPGQLVEAGYLQAHCAVRLASGVKPFGVELQDELVGVALPYPKAVRGRISMRHALRARLHLGAGLDGIQHRAGARRHRDRSMVLAGAGRLDVFEQVVVRRPVDEVLIVVVVSGASG